MTVAIKAAKEALTKACVVADDAENRALAGGIV